MSTPVDEIMLEDQEEDEIVDHGTVAHVAHAKEQFTVTTSGGWKAFLVEYLSIFLAAYIAFTITLDFLKAAPAQIFSFGQAPVRAGLAATFHAIISYVLRLLLASIL